jgi:glucosyl-3-phosphoglycerate synthase
MSIRTYNHRDFSLSRIAESRVVSVSVCVPTRECAETIGPIAATLMKLREDGAVDEVVVVDAGSADGTAAIAACEGAHVLQQDELAPSAGPVLGKGDAMWRSLSVLRGDVVCFVDGDTTGFDDHFVRGLIGPLCCEQGTDFVKATYRRPFTAGEVEIPDAGGRVSQLLARPLIARFYPDLADLEQPLAGEIAARRELLERIPFVTGYGVEIGMLIDVLAEVGADAIAQVDLGERRNAHQPLHDLRPMADSILGVVAARLEADGRLEPDAEAGARAVERPALARR